MPRTCNECDCHITTVVPALSIPTQAFANMSYVGFVKLDSAKLAQKIAGVLNQVLRVNSCDIKATQRIEKVDVIDGRIDPTVYRIMPFEVGGSIVMPVILDTLQAGTCPTGSDLQGQNSVAGKLLNLIWCWGMTRDPQGRMAYDDVNAIVRLANHAAYKYTNCVVNSLAFSCTQGDLLSVTIDVLAQGRQSMGAPNSLATGSVTEANISDYLSPARSLQWNDISITGVAGCSASEVGIGNLLFSSNLVRSWDMNINNSAERFYGFNGSLFPVDVNAGKREVTGSLELLGISENLRVHAENNRFHFTEKNKLNIAFYAGDETYQGTSQFRQRDWITGSSPPGSPIFYRKLAAVVYEIEEAALTTNGLFTSTVNYTGFASDEFEASYEAFEPNTSYFPIWE